VTQREGIVYVHTPVLLEPVLRLLEPESEEPLLIDATLGEGGHAEAFLSRFPSLSLYGVEKDEEILRVARQRLARFGERVQLFQTCFGEFFAEYEGLGRRRPDRILFDLGISMFHFEKSGRGFSFARNEPLDMRIDGRGGRTAADILNESSQEELEALLRRFGEEPLARGISRAIVRSRQKAPITEAAALAEVVRAAVPPARRYGRIHPATRTFQALRISVNRELELLPEALEHAFAVLNPGGRLGVIAFHSLEDRIVKRFLRGEAVAGRVEVLTKKPVVPGEDEIARNPRARSAKLRAGRVREVGSHPATCP